MHSKSFFAAMNCAFFGFLMGCSDDPSKTACDHDISGAAKSVEFVVHSGATTPRFYATKCDSHFTSYRRHLGMRRQTPGYSNAILRQRVAIRVAPTWD
jgi:hypothetical protein